MHAASTTAGLGPPEGPPPPPSSPGPLTSPPEGVLFLTPSPHLTDCTAGRGLGAQSCPLSSSAGIRCAFGADTLIPKPEIVEGLCDSGVPSLPPSPAWQECHYYCEGSRSWAAPRPRVPGL